MVARQMDALIAAGDGELDHSALAYLLSKLSGLEKQKDSSIQVRNQCLGLLSRFKSRATH